MAEEDSTGPRRRGKPSSPRQEGSDAKKENGETKASGTETTKEIDFSGPLQNALGLMEKEKFAEAAKVLEQALDGLEKEQKDVGCLHNLGVCYTELGALDKAEEVFWEAYERSPKGSPNVVKTMYGLSSVLTSQDDPPKLMVAEAILREVVEKGLHNEGLVEDTYRSFVLLANNLGRQKKWPDAVQAWESAVAMGENMFGAEHEMVVKHRSNLTRAQKLARWQGRLRYITYSFFIIVPTIIAWWFRGRWPKNWFPSPNPELKSAMPNAAQMGLDGLNFNKEA